MIVETIKIMGYGGGPGCSFGNTYEGKFSLMLLKEKSLWKVTAVEEGLKNHKVKDSDKAIDLNKKYATSRTDIKYIVEKGEVFYIGKGYIQEMA